MPDTDLGTTFLHGFALVCAGGVLTGLFAGPMKFLTRWKWENIWLVYALVAMVIIPVVTIGAMVPHLAAVYAGLPPARSLLVLGFGYLWGLGSVLFGLGVDRLGMGLGFSLIMGVSTLLGTLLPFAMAGQIRLKTGAFLLGLALLIAALAVCGVAGVRREHAQRAAKKRGNYASGLMICLASGVLSSLFNIGMVLARPVQEAARAAGASPWASGNAVWPMLLFGGFLANGTYCGWLLQKNGTGRLYANGGWREWVGAFTMGATWISGVMLYGAGAFAMGTMGPILGFPVFTSLMLVCAYLLGRITGEWRSAGRATLRWMNAGIALSVISLFLIGYSR